MLLQPSKDAIILQAFYMISIKIIILVKRKA